MFHARFRSLSLAFALAAAFFASVSVTRAAEEKPVKVFLLAGQSNMVGCGTCSELKEPYYKPHPTVKIWSRQDKQWVPLAPGMGGGPKMFGPEVAFGHAIQKAYPDDKILLIKYAAGGTALYNDWAPTSGPQYRQFMATAKAALDDLEAAKVKYEIVGMLWLQGESDAHENQAESYEKNLTDFIGHMREQFKSPQMPFVLARVLDFYGGKTGQAKIVRDAQQKIGETITRCAWFDTDSCSKYNAGHYGTQGQIDIGNNFAKRLLAIVNAKSRAESEEATDSAAQCAPPAEVVSRAVLTADSGGSVKVFILAGQSNMEGQGEISSTKNEGKGTLEYLVKHDPAHYKQLVDKAGNWAEREDVLIWYLGRKGGLKAGYGVKESCIGPELGFGWVVGDAIEEPVLLIKTAWGGKSIGKDFRPPSSGGEVGPYYTEMLKLVKETMRDADKLFPQLKGRKLELVGLGWHQGWNDRVNQAFNDAYEENMSNFIRDVRKELGAPKLPVVIAETGMSGREETHPRALSLMKAQAAVAERPEFKGNVAFVGTRDFYRKPEDSPSNQQFHWNRNAETYYLIGKGMGEAMLKLIK